MACGGPTDGRPKRRPSLRKSFGSLEQFDTTFTADKVAGHVPDTAITAEPEPPCGWLAMDPLASSKAGGVLGSRVGRLCRTSPSTEFFRDPRHRR